MRALDRLADAWPIPFRCACVHGCSPQRRRRPDCRLRRCSPFRGNIPSATVALGLAVAVSLVAALGTRVAGGDRRGDGRAVLRLLLHQAVRLVVHLERSRRRDDGAAAGRRPHRRTALGSQPRATEASSCRRATTSRRIQAIAELMASGAPAIDVVAAVGVRAAGPARTAQLPVRDDVPRAGRPDDRTQRRCELGTLLVGIRRHWDCPARRSRSSSRISSRRRGRYVLVADPGTKVTREQLLAAVTLADQAGRRSVSTARARLRSPRGGNRAAR